MRKIAFYLAAIVIGSIAVTSCMEEPEVEFENALLLGKWNSGTLYYKYLSDGLGTTWDTADDVDESEAQEFEWTLVKSDLTHIHIMTGDHDVIKIYTVTELTSTTLKYKDEYGKSFTFTKVSS